MWFEEIYGRYRVGRLNLREGNGAVGSVSELVLPGERGGGGAGAT